MKYYIHVLIILLAIVLTGCGPESGEVQIDMEELLAQVPAELRLDRPLDMPPALTELDLERQE